MEPKGFLKIYFAFYFSPKDADKNDFYQFIKQELVKPRTFTGNNFIKNYRIKVIKNMLMNLDYSIGEIAEILGYTNTASLTRMFKSTVKVTPSFFVKNYQNKNLVILYSKWFNVPAVISY